MAANLTNTAAASVVSAALSAARAERKGSNYRETLVREHWRDLDALREGQGDAFDVDKSCTALAAEYRKQLAGKFSATVRAEFGRYSARERSALAAVHVDGRPGIGFDNDDTAVYVAAERILAVRLSESKVGYIGLLNGNVHAAAFLAGEITCAEMLAAVKRGEGNPAAEGETSEGETGAAEGETSGADTFEGVVSNVTARLRKLAEAGCEKSAALLTTILAATAGATVAAE